MKIFNTTLDHVVIAVSLVAWILALNQIKINEERELLEDYRSQAYQNMKDNNKQFECFEMVGEIQCKQIDIHM